MVQDFAVMQLVLYYSGGISMRIHLIKPRGVRILLSLSLIVGLFAGVSQAEVGAVPVEAKDPRITSYNVCYTKLLRKHGSGEEEVRAA